MFYFYETTPSGDPKEKPKRIHHREIETVVMLRCRRMNRNQLKHFIELAMAAPNHPVDITHFERGALVFSARMLMEQKEEPHAKQYFDCTACGYRHMRGIACPG